MPGGRGQTGLRGAGPAPGAALGPWSVPGPRARLPPRCPRSQLGQRARADAGLHLPAGSAAAPRAGTRRSAGSFEGIRGERLWRGAGGEAARSCRAASAGPRRIAPAAAQGLRSRGRLPAGGAERWGTPGGHSSEMPPWHSPPAARGRLSPGPAPGAAPLSRRPALGSSLLPGPF